MRWDRRREFEISVVDFFLLFLDWGCYDRRLSVEGKEMLRCLGMMSVEGALLDGMCRLLRGEFCLGRFVYRWELGGVLMERFMENELYNRKRKDYIRKNVV